VPPYDGVRVVDRIRNLIDAEVARARAMRDATDEERGRWFRRLFLITAAVTAVFFVQTLVNPVSPTWFSWMIGLILVVLLLQAATAPWFARHSKPRRRDP
jgi:hypothetical protein